MDNIMNNNMLVTLTVAEMHDLIQDCIKEALQSIQPKQEEKAKYLTRLQACEALKISLPTLSRYSELGLIPAKRIGNRILFLESDIQSALVDIPAKKLRQ